MAAAKKNGDTTPVVKETLYEKIQREITDKANELTKELGVEVIPFCFSMGGNDFAIGYFKDPDFQVKKLAMDMGLRGNVTDAGELILNTSLIKQHSDPRIYDEDSETKYPKLRLGAILRAKDLVSYYYDVIKKK